VRLPESVEVGVSLEKAWIVSEVVTPAAVAVTVSVLDPVSVPATGRLCESVLASEALSDEPPELTRPSVPSTCESVARSELVPLPLSVGVELSVEVPVPAELAVVPARLDENIPAAEELPLPTIRLVC